MRPPVVPGVASAKIPCGASTAFRMSWTGRCQSAFSHSTGGSCCARSNAFDGAHQVLLRRVGREHRAHLVLLAVEPGDEQHLRRPAAVPVALLVVRPDAAHAGAEALHVHRGVGRVALAAIAIWYSAVDEQPVVPTLPFDQGCFCSHSSASSPSLTGAPRMS